MPTSDTKGPITSSAAIPTPSSSPKQRHKQKKSDLFLELPLSGDAATDDVSSQSGEADESLLKRIVMTPLVFVSFILSLFLVERRNRLWRVQQSSSNGSSWSLRSWLDPEPYQNPDSTWQHSKSGGDGTVPVGQQRSWFTRKKHRKMTKLQFGEAFELRGTVMTCLVGLFIVAVLVIGWGVKSAFGLGA